MRLPKKYFSAVIVNGMQRVQGNASTIWLETGGHGKHSGQSG